MPQAEACLRTEDGTDRSITVTRHSAGPIGAKHRDYVWNSCCEPHLGSGHVRPHQQTGHMAAIASIRNRIPPLASRGPSTYGLMPQAEACLRTEDGTDHAVTI